MLQDALSLGVKRSGTKMPERRIAAASAIKCRRFLTVREPYIFDSGCAFPFEAQLWFLTEPIELWLWDMACFTGWSCWGSIKVPDGTD